MASKNGDIKIKHRISVTLFLYLFSLLILISFSIKKERAVQMIKNIDRPKNIYLFEF